MMFLIFWYPFFFFRNWFWRFSEMLMKLKINYHYVRCSIWFAFDFDCFLFSSSDSCSIHLYACSQTPFSAPSFFLQCFPFLQSWPDSQITIKRIIWSPQSKISLANNYFLKEDTLMNNQNSYFHKLRNRPIGFPRHR